jgi:hypothetical protein
VEKAVGTLELATMPGRWLVDYVPILRYVPAWFPGADFKKSAAAMGKLLHDMAEVPYQLTIQKMVTYNYRHCRTFSYLYSVIMTRSPQIFCPSVQTVCLRRMKLSNGLQHRFILVNVGY